MGRYSACAIDDDEVEVDEANSDPALEPWQDGYWKQPEVAVKKETGVDEDPWDDGGRSVAKRLLSAVVPFGRRQEAAASPVSMGNDEDDDGLETPSYLGSVHFIGTRKKGSPNFEEENDSDSDGTVDLTGFYAVSETPSEVPRYIRNVLPQARNDCHRMRFRDKYGTGNLRANEWVRLGNGEPQASNPTASPPSSPHNLPTERKPRLSRTIFQSVVVVFAGILVKYIVSRAPPPPTQGAASPGTTWQKYIQSSLSGATQSAGYIFSTIMMEVRDDIFHLCSKRCGVVFPAPMISGINRPFESATPRSVSSPIESYLLEEIVGQERAIKSVARGLDYWAESSQLIARKESQTVVPVHASEGKPYVMVFAGSEGVGKAATARRIAQLAFQHCPHGQDGVLELHGEDFEDIGQEQKVIDNESDENVSRQMGQDHVDITPKGYLPRMEQDGRRLTKAVVDHLRRQNGVGAVVILRQFDMVSSSAVAELLNPLKRGSEAKLSYWSHSAIDGEDIRVEASCRNTLFILTTDVGSRSIIQAVRSRGGMEQTSIPDLERSIKDELDVYFGHISQVINVVAPFTVLGRDEVKAIVRQRIKNVSRLNEGKLWKRLDLSEDALHLFTGPEYISYVQLLRKEDTDSTLSPFSERGAHALDELILMQMLKGRAMRFLAGESDRIKLDSIAVFSVSPDKNKAILSWCPDKETIYEDTGGSECAEIWHEPIL